MNVTTMADVVELNRQVQAIIDAQELVLTAVESVQTMTASQLKMNNDLIKKITYLESELARLRPHYEELNSV